MKTAIYFEKKITEISVIDDVLPKAPILAILHDSLGCLKPLVFRTDKIINVPLRAQ